MRSPPTFGSFSIAVFTRVVMVVSSMASPTVLPQPAASDVATMAASNRRFQLLSFFIGLASVPGEGCNLHARDVIAGVDHQDFTSHALGGIAEEKRRGFADLRRVHVAPQRRALAIDVENGREASDPHRR